MISRQDIQLDENDDLILQSGDFVWGSSDSQHIEDSINAYAGWWKENFSDGVGIGDYVNSDGQEQQIARAITIELQSDLYEVTNPSVSFNASGQLILNPNAK